MLIESKEKNYIIYLAYGSLYVNECLYSIASLINLYNNEIPSDINLLVFSDSPEKFKFLLAKVPNLCVELIELEKLKSWASETGYIYRSKIKLLQYISYRYNGNFIFVDTDIYFRKKPDKLFRYIKDKQLLMHCNEGNLTNLDHKEYLLAYDKQVIKIGSTKVIKINTETEMWNSGVIGFSSDQSSLLKEVLTLNDALYSIRPLRTVEQLAFACIFNSTGRLTSTKKFIFHYWHIKEDAHRIISTIFTKKHLEYKSFLHFVKKNNLIHYNYYYNFRNKIQLFFKF